MIASKFTQAILYASTLLLMAQTGLAITEEATTPEQPEKKLYRSFNAEGVPEFSDKPGKHAEEVELPTLPTYKPTPMPRTILAPKVKKLPKTPTPTTYQQLTIVAPTQDEVIHDNSGNLSVQFVLKPPLKTGLGHQLQFFINGQQHQVISAPATLGEVYQGTHSLIIKLVDSENRLLMTSNSVTFHKKRHVRKKPAKQAPAPKKN